MLERRGAGILAAGIGALAAGPEVRAGVVVALASIALAPVAVFAPNGTVVLVCVAAVALALDPVHRRAALRLAGSADVALLGALLAWAALAALWSFDPARGLWLVLRLALLFAAGLILLGAASSLSAPEARVAHRGMALGALLLIALMLIETTSGAGLTRFLRGISVATLDELSNSAPLSRGGIVLALSLWPALVVLPQWYGRWGRPVAALAAAIALWLQPVEATAIAALAGLAALAAARLVPPSLLARAGAVAVVALLLAPPVFAAALPAIFSPESVAEMPQSHRHRVQIWTYTMDRIAERPVLGWGFDSSRELMGTGEGAARPDAPMSLHTHNAPLQAWLELGLPGFVLIAALGWQLWRRCARLGALAPAALAGMAGTLVYLEISRGAWQYWFLAVLWLFAAWIAALRRPAAD